MITRADVERALGQCGKPAYLTDDVDWRELYGLHVSWLLSQLDRLETERRALAEIIAEEVTA